MDSIPINNERYLHRELSSKALLSTDQCSLQRYKEQTAIIERNKKQLSEVETIKEEVKEIKKILLQLLALKS